MPADYAITPPTFEQLVSHDRDESWIQIRFETDADAGEALADALWEAGALSVTLEDAADDPVLEPAPGEAPLWPHTAVIGLFEPDVDTAQVIGRMREVAGAARTFDAQVSTLAGREWVTQWKADFHAMRFGERLWICPQGERVDDANAVTVRLEPGLAFGTGTHPSTALCLEWLDRHCRPGDRMIDYGCGSGILAIAAARLGAATVWAVDIDPQALLATRENATTNGVGERVLTRAPEELEGVEADCLVANILARPLIDLAPRFATLLARDGRLVVAGILADQAEAVATALARDFDVVGQATQDGWVRIDARRRGA